MKVIMYIKHVYIFKFCLFYDHLIIYAYVDKNDNYHNKYILFQSLESQLHCLIPSVEPKSALKSYISATVDLCWLMNVQDPPCTISWDLRKGESFQTDKYKVFTHSGKLVEYIVWPVLYLHQGGGVLCKGVAEGMREKHEEPEDEVIIVTTVMPQSGEEEQTSLKINLDSPVNQHKYEWITEVKDVVPNDKLKVNNNDIMSSTGNVHGHSSYEEMDFKQTIKGLETSQSAGEGQANRTETSNTAYISEQTANTNGSAFENLYAMVNKPKQQKTFDSLINNKTSTEAGYAEVELVAEEECITRF